MKSFLFFLCLLPVSAESLHYSINWASGLSLGEATLRSDKVVDKGNAGWDLGATMEASIPGFTLRDEYHATATADLCSLQLEKTFTHGTRKTEETDTFDPKAGSVTRQTKNGGKADVSVSSCAKDALTFLQFARRELGQGRLAPQQPVVFGAQYNVRLEFTGTQKIKLGDQQPDADRILVTIKGPTTDLTVELFFARDAARTPLLARIPLALGSFTVELIR